MMVQPGRRQIERHAPRTFADSAAPLAESSSIPCVKKATFSPIGSGRWPSGLRRLSALPTAGEGQLLAGGLFFFAPRFCPAEPDLDVAPRLAVARFCVAEASPPE